LTNALTLTRYRKRDDGHLLAVNGLRVDRGVVFDRCLDDTVRGDPQLVQSVTDGRNGCGRGILTDLVPGIVTAQRLELALFADQRDPAATASRRVGLGANEFVPHRWWIVIDRTGVALEVKAWPRRAGRHALAERKIGAAPAILQRLRVAHRLRHTIEDRLGVLTVAEPRHQQQGGEYKDPFLRHMLPPFAALSSRLMND